jgi:hypothetical protein
MHWSLKYQNIVLPSEDTLRGELLSVFILRVTIVGEGTKAPVRDFTVGLRSQVGLLEMVPV